MTVTVTTDRTLFKQTIIAWLVAMTGIPAEKWIWANQSTPRKAKPYGTIFFPSGFVKVGIDEERIDFNQDDEKIEKTTTGPRTIAAQIEVYTDPATTAHAPEATEILENALFALDTGAVRDMFRAAKIGVIGHTPPQSMDEQFGDRWERRALADVTFAYSGETFDAGTADNWVETVETPTEANGNADYGVEETT